MKKVWNHGSLIMCKIIWISLCAYFIMKPDEGGLALYATGNNQEATMFFISISVKGGLWLATAEGMYVNFDSSDNNLKANLVNMFGIFFAIFRYYLQSKRWWAIQIHAECRVT